jgi:hypothetical protein
MKRLRAGTRRAPVVRNDREGLVTKKKFREAIAAAFRQRTAELVEQTVTSTRECVLAALQAGIPPVSSRRPHQRRRPSTPARVVSAVAAPAVVTPAVVMPAVVMPAVVTSAVATPASMPARATSTGPRQPGFDERLLAFVGANTRSSAGEIAEGLGVPCQRAEAATARLVGRGKLGYENRPEGVVYFTTRPGHLVHGAVRRHAQVPIAWARASARARAVAGVLRSQMK